MKEKLLQWLKENTTEEQFDNCIEVTTTLSDRHNDCLQFYIEQVDNQLILTDNGNVINDLELCGMDISSYRTSLQDIANQYGVEIVEDEICVAATVDSLTQKKYSLIQTMSTISNLTIKDK